MAGTMKSWYFQSSAQLDLMSRPDRIRSNTFGRRRFIVVLVMTAGIRRLLSSSLLKDLRPGILNLKLMEMLK